ncbi:DUF294 nucleotidyltransferase-like domain-containing protein [Aquabacterium humicola]|uniref:DUF294 nucleotidyltransferase-like domain-containing protein n=1 Tax=Aquabacterium humicola TaxID=3237377 RepID=UPI002543AB3F|nr:DUF294 nucleotidyltransferase-like domain-containing protein [Rubrivivax pictus]
MSDQPPPVDDDPAAGAPPPAASQWLAEQSLEAPLGGLPRRPPLQCRASTPLGDALRQMDERRVGSVLVADDAGVLQGILTRHDVLSRVTLPQRRLDEPIGAVMSTPVLSLAAEASLQDAALLMLRHGIRHVPVTEDGRVINVVSERDLFALQRLSLRHLSAELRTAPDLAALQAGAAHIRGLAHNLLQQGVQARQLTELISHLNDLLTERLVVLEAQRAGLNLARACWLAFGSEGRSEQTIATDQDNGLVLDASVDDAEHARWLAFGQAVNRGLDACGYPLCKGGVMAGNADCCLTQPRWLDRFGHWILHGAPEDLLNASIYFDLRPLAGNTALAQPLRELIVREGRRTPRFCKQLADNALQRRVPLNWRGAIATATVDGRETLDLKLQGTAIFVDAARLYALAQGVAETNTRLRLAAVAPLLHAEPREADAWIGAFECLQALRLRVQVGAAPDAPPNLLDVGALNDMDRPMLHEALRVARRLQQRIELDHGR